MLSSQAVQGHHNMTDGSFNMSTKGLSDVSILSGSKIYMQQQLARFTVCTGDNKHEGLPMLGCVCCH